MLIIINVYKDMFTNEESEQWATCNELLKILYLNIYWVKYVQMFKLTNIVLEIFLSLFFYNYILYSSVNVPIVLNIYCMFQNVGFELTSHFNINL